MSAAKARAALDNFTNLGKLIQKMERTALELMYHPDATPEQLKEVSAKLAELRPWYGKAYHALLKMGYPEWRVPNIYKYPRR